MMILIVVNMGSQIENKPEYGIMCFNETRSNYVMPYRGKTTANTHAAVIVCQMKQKETWRINHNLNEMIHIFAFAFPQPSVVLQP
jgi:hypothetical protein